MESSGRLNMSVETIKRVLSWIFARARVEAEIDGSEEIYVCAGVIEWERQVCFFDECFFIRICSSCFCSIYSAMLLGLNVDIK